MMSDFDANISRALNVIDETWQRVSSSFLFRAAEGRSFESFPDLSEAAADRTQSAARASLAVIDALNMESLPHELAITAKIARFRLVTEAQAMDRYWLADGCGGFPALFTVAPYGGGYLFSLTRKCFTDFVFSLPGDCDRYIGLVQDYAHFVDQIRRKLEDQAARGIRIPKPALPGIRALLARQAEAARRELRVDSARLNAVSQRGDFCEGVARLVENAVVPAFHQLLDTVGEGYCACAPETVGMAQFKDGGAVYETLVTEHVSIPMTIEAVHETGLEYMARVEAEMAEIRSGLGHSSRDEFHHFLVTDAKWVGCSEYDVQARFDAAIRRIEPTLHNLFRIMPAAPYRTTRLDRLLESGMTYGYYQRPVAGHPDGVYYFNASNVSERTLATASSLIYHELIPGHHFHIARQLENRLLHPLRHALLFNAFNEGWAEYAATLAGEIGMYVDPCERYGRLMMDALFTSRLVVDTGMNALGWTLERARQYMRDHTALSRSEIESETLRYSTDIPAQSLAYKIGQIKLTELRARVRRRLGGQFDIRDFHEAVLGSGGMPLEVLNWHADYCLAEQYTNAQKYGPVHREP